MILDDIVSYRKKQLEYEKEVMGEKEVMDRAAEDERIPKDFLGALQKSGLSVIAEVKKASGANAISVLTEKRYFEGSSEYLQAIREKVDLPILRKDFIIDAYQVYESLVIGADAVLLIAALLDSSTIARFMRIADTLGLACLVEVHNEKELRTALDAGARMIGVNNRDLKTFEVDLQTTQRLAKLIPADRVVVAESGILTNADMKAALSYGADAVLVGETLMRSDDIPGELARLRQGV